MKRALAAFRPGRTIYIPGATGEPLALTAALRDAPERLRDVTLVSCLLPGMNEADYLGDQLSAHMTTFLLPAGWRSSFAGGRVRVLPLGYTDIASCLGQRMKIDVAVAQLSPPGPDGLCSLSIAADFTSLAWARAALRIALVNPAMPSMRRGPRLALADADIVVECEAPVLEIPAVVAPNPATTAIGRTVARLVPNGASIQIGIGGAPAAVWEALGSHRDLVVISGMVAEKLRPLAETGVLREGGPHVTGVAMGTAGFYRFLAESDLFRFAAVPETHGLRYLSALDGFVSVNGALEVDLFGQVNLEWQNGQLFSGIGGAVDFMRAARQSTGGRSVIALPSTGKGGAVSRIVPRLAAPSVSIGRAEIDTVVTEYGVAALRDLALDDRAQALIDVAAPPHRETLARAWHDARQHF
jgi:acyl-CoA hydrolase